MENRLHFRERCLGLLKNNDPQTLLDLAAALKLTVEGARFQIRRLEAEGLVRSEAQPSGRGRPQQFWSLTQLGESRFPDTHASLTVRLMEVMKETLGELAVSQVISVDGDHSTRRYLQALEGITDPVTRITRFAAIRSTEGYMAQFIQDDLSYIFVENHCPINVAAHANPAICCAEFKTLKAVVGEEIPVNRIEYIVAGNRRCAYRVHL